MHFDPLHDGQAFRARVSSPRRPGHGREAWVVSLGFGELVQVDSVSYQAVPYAIDPAGRDQNRNRHPLVQTDAGHSPVPLGAVVIEDVATGERRFGEHDERFEGLAERIKADSWTSERRIRYADSLIADPARHIEAFGHYLGAVEMGGPHAALAHLRLGEWQARDGLALPTQSTADPVAPDVARSIAAHLIAAAGGDPNVRHRSGEVALAVARRDEWRGAGAAALDGIASRARECGDGDWAAQLMARAATGIAGQERSRAVRWITPALQSESAETREAGVAAGIRVIDAARLTQDKPVVNAVVSMLEASRLSAAERAPLLERITQARAEMQGQVLDGLLYNVAGRIGDRYDLRLDEDINSLVTAGGRWRDGIVKLVVDETVAARRQAELRRRPEETVVDEAYSKLLDTAIRGAESAGDIVAADRYGIDFAVALGPKCTARAYVYVHRALGSSDPHVRGTALKLALPLALLPQQLRPYHLRAVAEIQALNTPEARELLAALGQSAATVVPAAEPVADNREVTPLVGHARLEPAWQTATGHTAGWSFPAPIARHHSDTVEPTDEPIERPRRGFGLLDRFRAGS